MVLTCTDKDEINEVRKGNEFSVLKTSQWRFTQLSLFIDNLLAIYWQSIGNLLPNTS